MINKKKFDLVERTAKFGEDIIQFAKKIPQNPITLPLITQLVKAGTVLEQITQKPIVLNQRKISNIKSVYVKKNLKKQNTGLE